MPPITHQVGQPIAISEPGHILLAPGQTYGRVISRPTVSFQLDGRPDGGPRAIVSDPGQLMDLLGGTGNVAIRGIHFLGADMNRVLGAVAMNGIDRLVLEDCVFEGCVMGLTAERVSGNDPAPRWVRVSGCVFRGNGGAGAFFESVHGLLVENSIFDGNGWGDRNLTGRPPDQSHGSYYIGVANSITRNCLFTRNRMNAMRGCGQVVERCMFVDNACGIAAGTDAMRISDNVVLWSHDHDPANNGRWGVGIDIDGGFNTVVERNVIAHNRGTSNIAGILVHGYYSGVKLAYNTIVGWDMPTGEGTAFNLTEHGFGQNLRTNNTTCQLRGGVEVWGQGQGLWTHNHNREVGPERLVNAYADPIAWADSVGKPGLTAEQAIEATVVAVENDPHALGPIMAWYREQFRVKA